MVSQGRHIPAPHVRLLSERLVAAVGERVLAEREGRLGEFRGARIIIEMPPRHSKSETTSHWFPVWLLNNWPHWRIILASYEADFAASWGRKVRNTIAANPDLLNVRISGSSSAANRWETTAGGGMVTAGVGGPITGKGGDVLLVDDPIKNWQEASSSTVRDHIWDWWTSTAYTRLEPGGIAIVIMTRWHQDDLAGRLIERMNSGEGEPWEVIRLPALAELDDPLGRKPGEALWPARYNEETLARIRQNVGEYVWQALYQQNPTTPGGTIFLRDWFEDDRRYDAQSRSIVNRTVARYISWDTAMRESDDAAYSAAVVGELWPDYRLGVREVYRERLSFPELCAQVEALASHHNRDGKLQAVVIEDKASGIQLLQTLRAQAPDWLRQILVAFEPKGDKELRARQASVWCANGSVVLPHPASTVHWLFDFERELFEFPRSAHADQVDAFSQLIDYLRNYLEAGLRARQGAIA